MTVPRNAAAMIAVWLGRISLRMIRQRPLPGRARRLDEVAFAQREGLRPQHPRAPGPAGQRDHQRSARLAGVRQVGGDDDGQRQRGDDQEDVGHHGQPLVARRRRGSRR